MSIFQPNSMDLASFTTVQLEDMNQPVDLANTDMNTGDESNAPLQVISAFLNVPGPIENLMTGLCPETDDAAEDNEDDEPILPPPATHPSPETRWYRSPFGHTFCLLLWMVYISSGGGITLLPMLEPTASPEHITTLHRLEFACWVLYSVTTLVLFIIASSLRRFYPPYGFPRAYLGTTIFVQTFALPYILSARSVEWAYSYAFTTQAVISVFVELCLHRPKVKRH